MHHQNTITDFQQDFVKSFLDYKPYTFKQIVLWELALNAWSKNLREIYEKEIDIDKETVLFEFDVRIAPFQNHDLAHTLITRSDFLKNLPAYIYIDSFQWSVFIKYFNEKIDRALDELRSILYCEKTLTSYLIQDATQQTLADCEEYCFIMPPFNACSALPQPRSAVVLDSKYPSSQAPLFLPDWYHHSQNYRDYKKCYPDYPWTIFEESFFKNLDTNSCQTLWSHACHALSKEAELQIFIQRELKNRPDLKKKHH